MIRFVDIRGQDIGHRFAFWNTVTAEFCTFAGSQAWDDADEFAADFRAAGGSFSDGVRVAGVERFTSLMPAWASQPATEDELMSPDDDVAAQAPAAEPLTDEQIVNDGLMMCSTKALDNCADAFEAGVKFAERAHGIAALAPTAKEQP